MIEELLDGFYLVGQKDQSRLDSWLGQRGVVSRVSVAGEGFANTEVGRVSLLSYVGDCLRRRFIPWIVVEGIR